MTGFIPDRIGRPPTPHLAVAFAAGLIAFLAGWTVAGFGPVMASVFGLGVFASVVLAVDTRSGLLMTALTVAIGVLVGFGSRFLF